MKVVNVRELKNNPSEAMRAAVDGPVIVLNRDTPMVVMLNANETEVEKHGVRVAIAIALYRDDAVTLAKAARIANMPLVDFMMHASAQGIPILKGNAQTLDEDLQNFGAWKKRQSSPTPGR
jgi:predicted HTH domain antitoxin